MTMPRAALAVACAALLPLGGCAMKTTGVSDPADREPVPVILKSNVSKYVPVSSMPEVWTDDYITARVPNGTRAMRLRVKRYPISGTAPVVRYLIKTDGAEPVMGWVHRFDTDR